MKHLGDITKIDGYKIPIVDCITGGSPCQDLSVAGNREGLKGERSGLFMEQIRIVKEMRKHDRKENGKTNINVRPRFMVWENVPGAFSSNGGKDFQAVLSEIVRIAESDAPDVPMPEKGKWTKAGVLYDEMGSWSIAWRVHDAQFWGTAQRRKRIAVLADFNGLCAAEVLFEREGLRGYFEQGEETREGTAATVGRSINETGERMKQFVDLYNQQITGETAGAVTAAIGGTNTSGAKVLETTNAISFQERAGKPGGGKGILIQNERTGALAAGRNQAVATFRKKAHARTADEGQGWEHTDTADCINVNDQTDGHTPNVIVENKTFALEGNGSRPSHHGDGFQETETMFTLNAVERHGVLRIDDIAGALCSDDHKGANNGFVSQNKLRITGTGVRRLTPLECERLQGFPDGWTDIGEWTDTKGKIHKESSDAARYKALGNSIAVGYANHASGFWCWLLKRISAQYERNATLGSLFDGIGGFPLAWEHYNGKGSAVWASEIEEFPIAVTKRRFGGE